MPCAACSHPPAAQGGNTAHGGSIVATCGSLFGNKVALTAQATAWVNQLPSKDRSFVVRKTRHIPVIYKAGCTNGSLYNPPLFGFAAMPREGYGRRTDDSAIPPLTQVRGFLAEVI